MSFASKYRLEQAVMSTIHDVVIFFVFMPSQTMRSIASSGRIMFHLVQLAVPVSVLMPVPCQHRPARYPFGQSSPVPVPTWTRPQMDDAI